MTQLLASSSTCLYFHRALNVGESITVELVSSWAGLDSVVSVHTYNMFSC